MGFLRTSLNVTNRKCLIVGSGPHARAVCSELLSRKATVEWVNPTATEQNTDSSPFEPSLAPGADPEAVTILRRPFEAEDLAGCWLVFAVSESAEENARISKLCAQQQRFCSVLSDNEHSTFQLDASTDTVAAVAPGTTATNSSGTSGRVSLVGAGPGDPDLLTLRALRRIQCADVIVYDRLVSNAILALCNQNAEFIYAGKAKANHSMPQNSINALLVELARTHQSVVRLKGGDPFIFGRGGEEIETLADEKIEFEVVPGITAASGCAAFSGIPLTHRDHAQSCVFVTGHLRDGDINLNWNELSDPQQTIVVYMGLTGLDRICQALIQHGRAASTPAALIEQGTKPEQRVLSATLGDLPQLVADSDVVAPTLLIIGGVVSLRQKLQWFNADT
jgi:uroporphyrin-III C-methyltransferase